MSAGVEFLLTQLHLTHAATVLPAWLERAAQNKFSYADFLLRRAGGDADAGEPPGLGKTILAICIATKLVLLGYCALRVGPALYEVIASRYER